MFRPVIHTTGLLLLAVLCPATADAQFGRGLPSYRAQGTSAYQFGYKPTYEIVLVNASLQDLEFRLTRHQNELQQWTEPNSKWVIPAGTFGTIDVMALAMQGDFSTRRGIRLSAEPILGAHYATFVVDEERVREFESRNEKGAIVIRDSGSGTINPDIEKVRFTTHTDLLARVVRNLTLLRSGRDRPGPEGAFVTYRSGGFALREGDATIPSADEVEKIATTGRIRQPGEQFVTVELVRAAGEIPAGDPFSVRIGHDLAYRTETGAVDGEGMIKLFTTRDRNIRLHFTIAGSGVADQTEFTLDPSRDDAFRVRIR